MNAQFYKYMNDFATQHQFCYTHMTNDNKTNNIEADIHS